MKDYSVLLLYPDDMNQGGQETYYEFVVAHDPAEAIKIAREHAVTDNFMEPDEAEDFFVLLVIEGHHTDINPERFGG